jgi:transposase InsO family protein
LARHNIAVRHSRLGRPNDNAHIERFNRTIQEECLGRTLTYTTTNTTVQARLTAYLDYYNTKRVHLGLQLRTPVSMLQRS